MNKPLENEERLAQMAERIRDLEARLAAHDAGLSRAQHMAKLAHVITGPDGAFESWSDTLPQLIGLDADQMPRTTREWLNILHPEDRAIFREKSIEAAVTGKRLEVEYRLTRGDGEWRHVRQVIEPLDAPASGQRSMRWFSTLQDISDVAAQKELERMLKAQKDEADAANRAKSAFLAVMSHEIRTPMNGVLGMLELLSLTNLDAEQRNTLNVVRESGRALQRIIDDILDFSKIEAGKLEVSPTVCSLSEIVQSVRDVYTGNASSKGLLLTCVVDPHIRPAVSVDPLRLRQILNNFVSNAIKFTDAGSVEIRADLVAHEGSSERVRISVKDTGRGMSSETQARLFTPFQQGSSDTARTHGGTGLGLTICNRLAEMMGGSITVASEVGKGTEMVLTISILVADPAELATSQASGVAKKLPAEERSAPSVAEAERDGMLVLFVDDHPVNRLLISKQLAKLGYAAESAKDGAEALEKWRSGRFAALITDCNMPVMDGYELARTIRKLEAEQRVDRIPIIACTANALRDEADTCLAAGMDDYLAKPVQLNEIAEKLERWLPKSRRPA